MQSATAKEFLRIKFKFIIAKYDKQLGKKGEELAETLANHVVSNFPEIMDLMKNEKSKQAADAGRRKNV